MGIRLKSHSDVITTVKTDPYQSKDYRVHLQSRFSRVVVRN